MNWVRFVQQSVALMLVLPAVAIAGAADEIQILLKKGDAGGAYQLATEHAPEQAGDTGFDFWLGMAALASGHADHAVFAFERVLLAEPNHHRARLELGRAYYRLGDLDAARRTFEGVLKIDPPVNVQHRVKEFLAAIERQQQALRTHFSGTIGVRAGYDSNINSATTDSRVEIPALGVLVLGADSLETEDGFSELGAALDLSHPLTKYSSAFANVALKERNNFSSETYDLGLAALSAGWVITKGSDRVRIPVTLQKLTLAEESYRSLISVGIEWARQQDPSNQWSVFGQAGGFRYADETSLDVNLKLAGAGWTHRWQAAQLMVAASAYAGDEKAVDDVLYAHNGKGYHGMRVGLESQRWQRHVPYAAVTYQSSEYDAEHPVFGARREDDFVDMRVGWIWKFRSAWSARAELSVAKNDSTLSLYEYDRTQFYVGVNYGFE